VTHCCGPGTIRYHRPLQISGHPELWSVVIPLWTDTGSRSDLTLEATIEDRAEGPVVEIGDIHVM
jgi:hypothetical protein